MQRLWRGGRYRCGGCLPAARFAAGAAGLLLSSITRSVPGGPDTVLPFAAVCRHAVAMCVTTPAGRLPLLAVAVKPSKRAIRFLVYELQPTPSSSGSGSSSSNRPPQLLGQAEVPDGATAVHGMGWVGGQLAVCAGVRYLLVSPFNGQWRELFSVPEELAYWPAMLTTAPDLGRALLIVVSRGGGGGGGAAPPPPPPRPLTPPLGAPCTKALPSLYASVSMPLCLNPSHSKSATCRAPLASLWMLLATQLAVLCGLRA